MVEAKFRGMEFTAETPAALSLEPVPDLDNLDLQEEAKKLFVADNHRELYYYLDAGGSALITSWEDEGGILRLAIAESEEGVVPIYREPTLEEMVRFCRVARFALPDSGLTNILQAQVVARLVRQSKAALNRAQALRDLAENL